jgi:AP-4 complex subunit sigma-1
LTKRLYRLLLQNEMAYLEFIHNLVETLDKYFENVVRLWLIQCELDIMFNIEKAHYILDEMIANGQIVETNKALILGTWCVIIAPLHVLDKFT